MDFLSRITRCSTFRGFNLRRWIAFSCVLKREIPCSRWTKRRTSWKVWVRMKFLKWPNRLRVGGVILATVCLGACRQDMHNQPRYKPLAESDFFADGRSARPAIAGTVARGHLQLDEARFTGKANGVEVNEFPFPKIGRA